MDMDTQFVPFRQHFRSMGLYTFSECGDVVNPKLGLRRGENYTFVQKDRTNYFHPLGITGASDSVSFYHDETQITEKEYHKKFVESIHDWADYSQLSVQVRFGTDSAVSSASYYCIIHHGMEGMIQLLPPASQEDQDNSAANIDKKSLSSFASTFRDERSEFDKRCGTIGLEPFRLPNALCPDRFVCGAEQVSEELQEFSDCLEAANCAMMSGMTTGMCVRCLFDITGAT